MRKAIDLTGKRFGKLVVLGLSDDNPKTREDGKKRWKCQCDCGNITYVLASSLKSGGTRGCGCGIGENFRGKSAAIDLTGRKFGLLTVLEREENVYWENGGRAAQWKCQCDCGNIVVKRSQGLLSGKTKSCGCLRKRIGNKQFLYQAGQVIETKYGRFLVEEAYREEREISKIRDKKYKCKCLCCGETNIIYESKLEDKIGSCKACSDSRSFGEKFFYWFLKQLEIDFNVEYSPVWAGRKRYDFHFVINNTDYIVEIDGVQHQKRYNHGKWKSLEDIQKIDNEKEKVTKEHNHSVIRIDCKESKGKFITNSIKSSELNNLFDLECIDWNKCFYMALSSKTRMACNLWNEGHKSTNEIGQIIKSNPNYVSKLLTQGADVGICDYDSKVERYKGSLQSTNGKKIICLDNGKIYESANECSRKSEEDFGLYLNGGGITRVCRKERKTYKGFHFEFVED